MSENTPLKSTLDTLESRGWTVVKTEPIISDRVYPCYVAAKEGYPRIKFWQFTEQGTIGEFRVIDDGLAIRGYNLEAVLAAIDAEITKKKWSKR